LTIRATKSRKQTAVVVIRSSFYSRQRIIKFSAVLQRSMTGWLSLYDDATYRAPCTGQVRRPISAGGVLISTSNN